MSPNMSPTQVQATTRRSNQSKTPKRYKETKQHSQRNGFSPNPSKQLQRSSPKSAFHPVQAYNNNGTSPIYFKRSSPVQISSGSSPNRFQKTESEDEHLCDSPSYAGAKFSEAPPPNCLPSPPIQWMNTCSMVPKSPLSFRQMEDSLKMMLKVAS